ncbi:DUF3299 domain-containing protein [Agaribacter flavus]|uniref:DUF3299 domain-containing protein n=1 Tax=Agaribacter flavus TaxID=1902781 RepID=UPI00366EEBEF
MERFKSLNIHELRWQDLIPETERELLRQYQQKDTSSFEDQMMQSIRASIDKKYINAMLSTNTVDIWHGRAVSISGFIVPIETNENRAITHFFVVPYYGACIHFPPPPPNQIIYAQVEDGINIGEIDNPFTFVGTLSEELFEDPIATSAYVLDVVSIETFYGQPDDFRQH